MTYKGKTVIQLTARGVAPWNKGAASGPPFSEVHIYLSECESPISESKFKSKFNLVCLHNNTNYINIC